MSKNASFSEAYPQEKFYPELPQVSSKDLIGVSMVIRECRLIPDFKTKFGTADFMLVKAVLNDKSPDIAAELEGKSGVVSAGGEFTTLVSGEVVMKKISRAALDNKLPLIGTIVKPKGVQYYDII